MKLLEVLASNFGVPSKREDAKTRVKILRKKADRKNRKTDDPDAKEKEGTIDSFAGYINNSFDQSNFG